MELFLTVCILHILSSFTVDSALVSKYTRPLRVTNGNHKMAPFIMERVSYKACKFGGLDLYLYNITTSQCIQECRARTKCKSINIFLRVNWCRINFEDNLKLNKDCPRYIYSSKANWIQKAEVGCESLNCTITQKCMKRNGKYRCVITECMNIPHLENGMVFGNDVKPGLTQAFMCNQGYEIKGDYRVTCQADGTWRPDLPTCIEKKKAASEASVTDEELTTRSYTAEEVSANSPSSQQPTTPTTSLTTFEKMAEPSTMSTTTEFSNTSKEAIKTGTTSPVEYHTQPSDKTFTDESVTKCPFPLVYDPKEDDCLDRITMSSNTSEDAVTTETTSSVGYHTQFSDNTVTDGTDRSKPSSSETPCILNQTVGGMCMFQQSDILCPFPQIYDPGEEQCVHHCRTFGTIYQVHQGHAIGTESYSDRPLVGALNYNICLDACNQMKYCAAISIVPPEVDSAGNNNVTCFLMMKIDFNISASQGWVYLRNCGKGSPSDTFRSPVSCDVGAIYSYSLNTCLPLGGCKDRHGTFQYLEKIGLDGKEYNANPFFDESESPSYQVCLSQCKRYLSCAVV